MPNRSTEQRYADRPACVYTVRYTIQVSPVHIKPNKLRVPFSSTHAECIVCLKRLVSVSESSPGRLSPEGLHLPDRESLPPLDHPLRQVSRHPASPGVRETGGPRVPVVSHHRASRGGLDAEPGPKCPFANALLFLHRDVLVLHRGCARRRLG